MMNGKELEKDIVEILDELESNYMLSNENGVYTHTEYVDYNDTMSKDYFLMDTDERLELEDGAIMNSYDYIYQNFSEEISDILHKKSDDVTDDDMSYAMDNVMNEIDIEYGIFEVIKRTNLRVNILMNTNEEWNTDYTNNNTLLRDCFMESEDNERASESEFDYIYNNSSIGALITSQGYNISDLRNTDKVNNSKFLQSLVNEWSDLPYAMSQLVTMIDIDGASFMSDLKVGSTITLKVGSTIGLFDKWNGSGSMLDIELEKPFTYTIDDDTELQVEGANNNYNYTVDKVYGLVRECWTNSYTIDSKKGVL